MNDLTNGDQTSMSRHRRESDPPECPDVEHARTVEDTALAAATRILGLPVGTLAALVTLLVALFGVWLTHDRAIAATTQEQRQALERQQQADERLRELEARVEKKAERDAQVAEAVIRIEEKLNYVVDDVTKRVERLERGASRNGR